MLFDLNLSKEGFNGSMGLFGEGAFTSPSGGEAFIGTFVGSPSNIGV